MRVVAAALGWLAGNRKHFVPAESATAFGPRQLKQLAELALMLRCYIESPFNPGDAEPLMELVRLVCSQSAFRQRTRSSRVDVLTDALVCSVTSDDELRRVVQGLVDNGALEDVERTPYQRMEERLALELGGFEHRLPSWQDLVDQSLLSQQPNAASIAARGAYHLTHDILHVHAFGLWRVAAAQLPDAVRDASLIPALTLTLTEDAHWDLVGELLLCWDCLALPDSPLRERGWRAFLTQQADDGSFPGTAPSTAPAEDAEARFRERYHTTLVAVILCCGRLSSETTSPSPACRASRMTWRGTLRDMALHQIDWLRASVVEAPGASADETRLGALTGVWICGALAGEPVGPSIDELGRGAEFPGLFTGVPPTLVMLAGGVLAAHKLLPSRLEQAVRAIAAVLRANPRAPADDLLLTEKRVLSWRLGLGEQPVGVELAAATAAAESAAATLNRSTLEHLLLTAESTTLHGTKPLHVTGGDRWVGELFLALGTHYCRTYELITASRLLRAAAHLDADSRDGIVRFLLCQRRPDGGFGGGYPVDSATFTLPVTINCLWAIAEACLDWRLFDSVRGALAPR